MDILDKLIDCFEADNFHFMATFLQAVKQNEFDSAVELHDLMEEFYREGNPELIDKRETISKKLRELRRNKVNNLEENIVSEEEYKKAVLEQIKEEMKKHYSESAWDLAHMVIGQDLIKIVIDETINVINSRELIKWR